MNADHEAILDAEFIQGYTGRQVRDAIRAIEAEAYPRCGCATERGPNDYRPASAVVCESCYIKFSR